MATNDQPKPAPSRVKSAMIYAKRDDGIAVAFTVDLVGLAGDLLFEKVNQVADALLKTGRFFPTDSPVTRDNIIDFPNVSELPPRPPAPAPAPVPPEVERIKEAIKTSQETPPDDTPDVAPTGKLSLPTDTRKITDDAYKSWLAGELAKHPAGYLAWLETTAHTYLRLNMLSLLRVLGVEDNDTTELYPAYADEDAIKRFIIAWAIAENRPFYCHYVRSTAYTQENGKQGRFYTIPLGFVEVAVYSRKHFKAAGLVRSEEQWQTDGSYQLASPVAVWIGYTRDNKLTVKHIAAGVGA